MTAAGNDFVMIDNRSGIMPASRRAVSALARRLCDRKYGAGADGMILLERSRRADFRMRYLNADGSEVSMCGNGARSIARFAALTGAVKKNRGVFETPAGIISYELKEDTVRIGLPPVRNIKLGFSLSADGSRLEAHFADTGVPHVVVFVDNLEKIKVVSLGRAIRYHKKFAPSGANADFVKIKSRSAIAVRTYERGVEDETLACGTGVTAAAIISGILGYARPPVKCLTRGGDILTVDYAYKIDSRSRKIVPSSINEVTLEGPARVVFTGRYNL